MNQPAKRRPADARAAAMYELYKQGYSSTEIARRFGTAHRVVCQLFERRGWPRRKPSEQPPQFRVDPTLAASLYARYRAGATLSELGREIGRHPGSVRWLFVRRGWEVEDRRRVTGERSPNYRGGRKPRRSSYGYTVVFVDGRWQFEHRLIMAKALGRQLKADEHVHHLNGDKRDNRLENLMVLPAGAHSVLHGTRPRRRSNPKLTADQVRAIRSRYAQGAAMRSLGREYGVSGTNIMRIVRRKTWADVE